MDAKKDLFTPYKTKRSFEEISDEIKTLIFSGELKTGDRLPSETEIARQFGVSRQTIREAMRILELSGFISIQRGVKGGPFVEDTVYNRISSLFLDGFKFRKISIEELILARSDIEKAMLAHVIKNADDSDIERLKDNIRRAKAKLKRNVSAFEENIAFHKLLARASKNYVYVIVVESIMAVLSDFYSRLTKHNVERSNRIAKCHEDILDAITRREYEAAVKSFQMDLEEVGEVHVEEK